VQDLERKGVIKGYRAVLDRFVNEVVECHNITGANEYLLRVETQDLAAYKAFHADVLGECEHVKSITTMVVTRI